MRADLVDLRVRALLARLDELLEQAEEGELLIGLVVEAEDVLREGLAQGHGVDVEKCFEGRVAHNQVKQNHGPLPVGRVLEHGEPGVLLVDKLNVHGLKVGVFYLLLVHVRVGRLFDDCEVP